MPEAAMREAAMVCAEMFLDLNHASNLSNPHLENRGGLLPEPPHAWGISRFDIF